MAPPLSPSSAAPAAAAALARQPRAPTPTRRGAAAATPSSGADPSCAALDGGAGQDDDEREEDVASSSPAAGGRCGWRERCDPRTSHWRVIHRSRDRAKGRGGVRGRRRWCGVRLENGRTANGDDRYRARPAANTTRDSQPTNVNTTTSLPVHSIARACGVLGFIDPRPPNRFSNSRLRRRSARPRAAPAAHHPSPSTALPPGSPTPGRFRASCRPARARRAEGTRLEMTWCIRIRPLNH